MKKFNAFLFIALLSVVLQGCYTVVWTPERELTEREEETGKNFYDDPGCILYYYDSPWWNTNLPSFSDTKKERENERGRNQNKLRDGGGREPVNPVNPIINIGTGSRNSDTSGGSGQPSGKKEEKKTNSDENNNSSGNSSGNTSGNSGSSNNERKSSDERSTRNADGQRSDTKGRK